MSPLEEDRVDGQQIRSLELTVLTQLRETLTANTAAVTRVGDKVDKMHDRVMAIELAKFDSRIEERAEEAEKDLRRTEAELSRRLEEQTNKAADLESRVRVLSGQVARYGAFLAVIGTVGGAALGAVITKVFGG